MLTFAERFVCPVGPSSLQKIEYMTKLRCGGDSVSDNHFEGFVVGALLNVFNG